jgi:hypothetical protein
MGSTASARWNAPSRVASRATDHGDQTRRMRPALAAPSQTPDARRQTPDARRQTPDTRRQTPDIRRQTPDARRQTPDTRHQTPDTRHQTPDVRPVPPKPHRREAAKADARRRCAPSVPGASVAGSPIPHGGKSSRLGHSSALRTRCPLPVGGCPSPVARPITRSRFPDSRFARWPLRVARSPDHPISRSPDHPITRSPDGPIPDPPPTKLTIST